MRRFVFVAAAVGTLILTGCGGSPVHPYPDAAVARFLGMCRADGNGQALCGCYIHSMQTHYSYAQVQAILPVNNSDAPEWDAVNNDCASIAAQ